MEYWLEDLDVEGWELCFKVHAASIYYIYILVC
jgi:hypothetical protein